jgi:hypothetical protein
MNGFLSAACRSPQGSTKSRPSGPSQSWNGDGRQIPGQASGAGSFSPCPWHNHRRGRVTENAPPISRELGPAAAKWGCNTSSAAKAGFTASLGRRSIAAEPPGWPGQRAGSRSSRPEAAREWAGRQTGRSSSDWPCWLPGPLGRATGGPRLLPAAHASRRPSTRASRRRWSPMTMGTRPNAAVGSGLLTAAADTQPLQGRRSGCWSYDLPGGGHGVRGQRYHQPGSRRGRGGYRVQKHRTAHRQEHTVQ